MVTAAALNCPNCGAPLVIRGFGHTLTVVCDQCLSVLDAKDPNLKILQRFEAATRIKPAIPLGTKGRLRGTVWQAIGLQVRTIEVEGTAYSWSEYLLFNPYKGFRYLTEYNGHWNDVAVMQTLPQVTQRGRPAATLQGERYKHFQTAKAKTTYVLGEFPWQARVGDMATAMDFISPPRMLSSEKTGEETTWSLGEYITGAQVWEAFQLPGKAPAATGVYANQPSPVRGRVGGFWKACLFLLAALFLLSQLVYLFARREEVFRGSYIFQTRSAGEPSFVTNVFDLKGRQSGVEVRTTTDLENNWAYFNYALIDEGTGQAYNLGREVSYYSGRDSDGNWTEGSRDDRAVIPSVPPGRYYLRVEPEMDPNAPPVRYEIVVRRDVPVLSFFLIAAGLLLIPPFVALIRMGTFERRRWAESDYSASSGE